MSILRPCPRQIDACPIRSRNNRLDLDDGTIGGQLHGWASLRQTNRLHTTCRTCPASNRDRWQRACHRFHARGYLKIAPRQNWRFSQKPQFGCRVRL